MSNKSRARKNRNKINRRDMVKELLRNLIYKDLDKTNFELVVNTGVSDWEQTYHRMWNTCLDYAKKAEANGELFFPTLKPSTEPSALPTTQQHLGEALFGTAIKNGNDLMISRCNDTQQQLGELIHKTVKNRGNTANTLYVDDIQFTAEASVGHEELTATMLIQQQQVQILAMKKREAQILKWSALLENGPTQVASIYVGDQIEVVPFEEPFFDENQRSIYKEAITKYSEEYYMVLAALNANEDASDEFEDKGFASISTQYLQKDGNSVIKTYAVFMHHSFRNISISPTHNPKLVFGWGNDVVFKVASEEFKTFNYGYLNKPKP